MDDPEAPVVDDGEVGVRAIEKGGQVEDRDGHGTHHTFAPAACGDCRDPPTPRLTTTAGLSEMTSCSSWSM
jgi:hypothetical protein